jgi:hypothetical protein
MRCAGRLLAAPFIGLAYVVALPFLCVFTLASELFGMTLSGLARVMGMAGGSATFGWRPMESYLSGRKERKGSKEKPEAEKKEEDGKEQDR